MNKPVEVFYGDGQHNRPERHRRAPDPEPYVPTADIVRAVNLALFLRRPLLIEGEAGAGKTRLAYAVASELGWPLRVWAVRSASKAQEGLYTYDAILRLYDLEARRAGLAVSPAAQNADDAGDDDDVPRRRDPSRPEDYRRLGALGQAFRDHTSPSVVLIDEIDKADIDFPNDLLTVLDRPWAFSIPETGERIAADPDKLPLVIITSNKEKGNLPVPFLRRCIYFYMEFPDEQRLKEIVTAHSFLLGSDEEAAAVSDQAITRFIEVRRDGALFKRPGLSEFIDWLRTLHSFGEDRTTLALLREGAGVPYPETLFKLRDDWHRYKQDLHGRGLPA